MIDDMPDNKVVISIYGEEYPIAGVEDSSHISKVADLVDTRMRATAEGSRVKARDKVAILTAMSLASEVMAQSEQLNKDGNRYDTELDAILARLDQALLT